MKAELDWSKFCATSFSNSSEFSPDKTARRRMKVSPSSTSTCCKAGRTNASMMAASRALPESRLAAASPRSRSSIIGSPMAAIDLRQEPLLAAEVVADARDVDAGGSRQLAHRDAVEPALREQALGGLEDTVGRPVLR